LTPLINPLKPASVSGKMANRVVESLFLGKKVPWARVLEDVVVNQVKLLGPDNLHNCLSGYLAPIYFSKNVLTQAETPDHRLIQDEEIRMTSWRLMRRQRPSQKQIKNRFWTL
jgi:hypothetical protein